ADNPTNESLPRAAELLQVSTDTLKTDIRQNIRGAAAVLAELANARNNGVVPAKSASWYTAVAAYSGIEDAFLAKQYADEVYRLLNEGVNDVVDGYDMYIEPRKVNPSRQHFESIDSPITTLATPDYPGAIWNPAHSSNYQAANRESDGNNINYVIIHTAQGSYSGTISWFKN